MKGTHIIVIVGVLGTILLFAILRHQVPNVYRAIFGFVTRILKGIFYAMFQFVGYVQGKPGRTQKSDKETIEKLTSKMKSLQQKYDTCSEELSSVSDQLVIIKKELEKSNKEKTKYKDCLEQTREENKKLIEDNKTLCGRFSLVSKEHVSDVFCEEFERVTSCIETVEQSLYGLIADEATNGNAQFLLEYLKAKQKNSIDEFYGWYSTLKHASSLTGAAAMDLDSILSFQSQLLYLREKAFVRYYRPFISALLLCMEQYRVESKCQQPWDDCISHVIDVFANIGIVVEYIPTGAVYDGSKIENILIYESKKSDVPAGIVKKVIAIGINSPKLDVPIQKTEIEMN